MNKNEVKKKWIKYTVTLCVISLILVDIVFLADVLFNYFVITNRNEIAKFILDSDLTDVYFKIILIIIHMISIALLSVLTLCYPYYCSQKNKNE